MVDLNFSGTWIKPCGHADLAIAPPPTAVPAVQLRGTLALPLLAVRGRLRHDARVSRPVVGSTPLGWQEAARAKPDAVSARWQATRHSTVSPGMPWAGAPPVANSTCPAWTDVGAMHVWPALAWTESRPCAATTEESSQALAPTRDRCALPWAPLAEIHARLHDAATSLRPVPVGGQLVWLNAVWMSAGWMNGFAWAQLLRHHWRLPWLEAATAAPGRSAVSAVPPPAVAVVRSTVLNLSGGRAAAPWLLAFGQRRWLLPIARVYRMTHDVAVVRLPDRLPLPVTALELSTDIDSWAWALTARAPLAILPWLDEAGTAAGRTGAAAGRTGWEIVINGVTWVMWVERFDVSRQFGTGQVTLQGRSRSAWLDASYAPRRSFVGDTFATARQWAEHELANTDFTLDWSLPDWLIPPGAWSYTQQCPMAALVRLAAAAGGVIQSDPADLKLYAMPRYPIPPWQWAQQPPDGVLPLSGVLSLGTRWQDTPEFDAVIVAGEQQGIVARVKRAGTAGSQVAEMVVDPLITHADVARARGMAVLASGGRSATVTLELPMTRGLLQPGQLLAIDTADGVWRGLVRATTVSAHWEQSLIVRQRLELERRD